MLNCPDCGHSNHAGEETCAHCHAPMSVLATPQPGQGMQKRILEGAVSDLKPHDATSLPEDTSLLEAIKTMRDKKVGCVLATGNGKLTGILTERELLLRSEPGADPAKLRIADVMRRDAEGLKDDEPLAYAFHKMTIHGMHHLAVRRADGSFGVVSARDLLRYLCE